MTRIWRAFLAAALALAVAAVAAPAADAGAGHAKRVKGASQADAPLEIVVKVSRASGYSIGDIAAEFPIEIDSAVLASHGIYLVRSADPDYAGDPRKTDKLAKQIARSRGVVYAEPNMSTTLSDDGYHAWPDGAPTIVGSDPARWSSQAAVADLRLGAAHALSTGSGVTVAVLDTGVDATHPVLAGRLVRGYDYVDDDRVPDDAAGGSDGNLRSRTGTAVGHGTFVSGLATLVAPGAKILPYRVLDGDGQGNAFTVAEAILDASAAGAKVINLSFGTADGQPSRILADAIKVARTGGAVVVAAAGNDGNDRKHYPAAERGVLSVTALASGNLSLASFADWGKWVEVAAPGQRVVGPVPGGRFATWSGTSMASPFVAGQAALLWGQAPGRSSESVIHAITSSAVELRLSRVAFGAVDIVGSLRLAAGVRVR